MSKPDYLPSQEVLLRLLDLDEATGALRWRERPGLKWWNARFAGQLVQTALDKDGYARFELKIDGRRVRARAHRVIFKMTHGYEPEMVDHRHGLDAGDGPQNLRAACRFTNRWNSSKRKGRELPKHVHLHKGRPCVQMKVAGVCHRKYSFGTVEAAEAYAITLARRLQGEFAPPLSLFDR